MSRSAYDSSWQLLPSTSTPLEKNLLRVTPFDNVLTPGVVAINTAKRIQIRDNWVGWLLLEYGAARIQEFVPDPRTALSEVLVFNRRVGTPSAILQAAGWLAMTVELEEASEPGIHFAEFQLKLITAPPSDEESYCRLWRAMEVAKPLRSRFRRIYNEEWDERKLILDDGFLEGGLLSDFSGEDGEEILDCGYPLRISLAEKHDMTPPDTYIPEGEAGTYYAGENSVLADVFFDSWPILDDDFAEPASFYANYMTVGCHAYEEGELVDDAGVEIVDENGDPILFRVTNG